MKIIMALIASTIAISNSALACDVTAAQLEAKRILTNKYGRENHVFIGATEMVQRTQGKDFEFKFSVLSKDPQFFELGDIGSIFVEQANECHGRLQAISSTLLK